MSVKKKTTFVYCWQVWMTAALAAPIFYWLSDLPDGYSIGGFLGFYCLAVFYGVVLSLISFFLFWVAAELLSWSSLRAVVKKSALCVWAVILTLVPFWFLFSHDDAATLSFVYRMAICYVLTGLIAIWLYKLP